MEVIKSFAIFEKLLHKEKSMKDALGNNFCVFQYIKKGGEKRRAYGTLKEDFISKRWQPTGKPSPSTDALKLKGYIQYWDIERNNFRQFTMDDGVELIAEYPTAEEMGEEYPKLRKNLGLPKYSEKKKEEKKEEPETEESEKNGDKD